MISLNSVHSTRRYAAKICYDYKLLSFFLSLQSRNSVGFPPPPLFPPHTFITDHASVQRNLLNMHVLSTVVNLIVTTIN